MYQNDNISIDNILRRLAKVEDSIKQLQDRNLEDDLMTLKLRIEKLEKTSVADEQN